MFNKLKSCVFWADALALVLSSIPYGMMIEVWLYRMTLAQSILLRAQGIPLDFVFGGLYGIWRSGVMKFFNGETGGWLKKWSIGSLAFASFMIPIYLATFFVSWVFLASGSKASWSQVTAACLTLIITAPMGDKMFEWCTRLFYWFFRISSLNSWRDSNGH